MRLSYKCRFRRCSPVSPWRFSLPSSLPVYRQRTLQYLRSTLPQKRIGDYIELSEDKNESDKYNLDDVCGISVDKRFIETKANMRDVNLRRHHQFV